MTIKFDAKMTFTWNSVRFLFIIDVLSCKRKISGEKYFKNPISEFQYSDEFKDDLQISSNLFIYCMKIVKSPISAQDFACQLDLYMVGAVYPGGVLNLYLSMKNCFWMIDTYMYFSNSKRFYSVCKLIWNVTTCFYFITIDTKFEKDMRT